MPRIKLTERSVQGLAAPHPSGKQTIYWDEKLGGFGVLCSGKTSVKTYIVQRALPPPDKRTRRVTIATVGEIALEAARREAGDKLHELRQGRDPKVERQSEITLRQALDDYLTARKDNLRPSSQRDYRIAVERYLKSWLDQPLRTITPKAVETRHRAIQVEVAAGGRYGGGTAANAAMRTLRILWNFAKTKTPSLPDNPVQLAKQWHAEQVRKRHVRTDDLPAFYAAVDALQNRTHRDAILLMMFTGMRRGETARLRWSHVDFGDRLLRLPAAITKGKRDFDLPMNDFVYDLLVARRSSGRDSTDMVFPSAKGADNLVDVQPSLNAVATATNIKISAHDLRRGFLNACKLCKLDWLYMKCLVNHALGRDITATYLTIEPEDLREPAQRVADKLKALCGIAEPAGENVTKLAKA